jgi:asparagine synthase (glutamine-hydrolysing)
MCGVAGLWDRRAATAPEALATAARGMTDTLLHRGPDAGDVWCDAEAGIALGHRRLSIIDLSPAGAQPMVSSCGRFVLSYNGEVYNAEDLRPDLIGAGRTFRGHSDTEIIVEGLAVWGVEATIAKLIGMFAMAIWDRRDRVLHLVRDRLGIKPMYWASAGGLFLFGSELKALRAHKGWQPELDRDAVSSYLRFAYVPGPATIYRGVRKLPPGTILTLRAGPKPEPEIEAYWTLEAVARTGQARRFAGTEAEAIDALDTLLGDAVRRRMVADVPLGAFLSGGIDSSTVVALMQKHSTRPVRSFSIGFREAAYNEAQHAAAVARHLGTDHTELYVEPAHALDVIPRLPELYDEPFGDPSEIPTFLVSEMTRRHVTVALSGDGGDELFAGYERYFRAQSVLRRLFWLPKPARAAAGAALGALPPAAWSGIERLVPSRLRPPQLGDKARKLARVLAGDSADFYRLVASHWADPDAVVQGGAEPPHRHLDPRLVDLVPDPVERMQFIDTVTYLPDDILTKVDRASMAVSLEARVPILDHRVVAFSWSLPAPLKARDGGGKWLLRRVLDRYVPRHLVERPKMGFGVPIDVWLRGPLRDWAEALLAERRLAVEGVFDPAPIRAKWQGHVSGARNDQYPLWNVLMFQAWKERWLP